MPTYRNNTSAEIWWKGIPWASGESRMLDVFVPHVALGLTKTSDSPAAPSPVLLSRDIVVAAGGFQFVDIPCSGRYCLSAVAVSGTAKMRIGSGTEDVILDASTDYECVLLWERAAMATLSSVGGATVRIVAEEVV